LFESQFLLNLIIVDAEATDGTAFEAHEELNPTHVILREVEAADVSLQRLDIFKVH
jgi:hypothetical protein